jgi:hypothetical protein
MLLFQMEVLNAIMKDYDWLIILIVIVVWVVLQFFVFPKLGMPC